MTPTQSVPAPQAPDVQSAFGTLRSKGLRISAARRLLLEALYAADGPVSAEQIAGGLGGRLPHSDLASVYRNLETLQQVGFVRHSHLGHGPARYWPTGVGEQEYMVCDSCNFVTAVEPVDLDAVRTLIHERFGYAARFSHFPILGLCPACAGEPS